jgi:hypothetical protein
MITEIGLRRSWATPARRSLQMWSTTVVTGAGTAGFTGDLEGIADFRLGWKGRRV